MCVVRALASLLITSGLALFVAPISLLWQDWRYNINNTDEELFKEFLKTLNKE